MPYEQRPPPRGVISSKQNLFSTFYTVDSRINWARIISDYLLLLLRLLCDLNNK